MLTSIVVRNFRAFRDLTLAPLARVNLIAGTNNAGKTSLLEAMYVASTPVAAGTLSDIDQLRGVPSASAVDAVEWAFHSADRRTASELETTDHLGVTRTCRIEAPEANAFKLDADYQAARRLAVSVNPDLLDRTGGRLVLWYEDSRGGRSVGVAIGSLYAHEGGWSQPCLFINSQELVRGADLAPADDPVNQLFSNVEAEVGQADLLAALRCLDARVEQLSLLLFDGRPTLHAQLAGSRRKVPLHYMGEGVRRVLLFALAIANARGGMVLIDEIENGVHYSVLPDVWHALGEAARRADAQVVATTHSFECIRAAHEAFDDDRADDLRLHRLESGPDGVRAVTYDRRTLGTSVEMNLEVR